MDEVLRLTQELLDCIAQGNWNRYRELCDPNLTCFEPEARGHLVEGLDFHQFYFKLGGVAGHSCTTMAAPRVHLVGDMAVVAYVRLNQRVGVDGPATTVAEETRIWQRKDGNWVHVHFHRSVPS